MMHFAAGILARRSGEEAEDAAAVPRHGMVDAEEAAAITTAAEGPEVRARAVGGHHRRRGDGDDQGPARRAPAGHQALPLPGARETGAPVPRHGRADPGQHLRPAAPPGVLRRREGDPGGRPGAAHGFHPAGEAPELAATDQGRGGDVRAGGRELPGRRAAVVVPTAAIPGPAPGVVGDVRVRGGGAGVLPGRAGPAVYHGALPVQVRQRQAQAHRAVLLLQLADVGRRQRAARVEEVQGPDDGDGGVAPAGRRGGYRGRGPQAPPLRGHVHVAQAARPPRVGSGTG